MTTAPAPQRRRRGASSVSKASAKPAVPAASKQSMPDAPAEDPTQAVKTPLGGDLLKAGLKALEDARGEVVTRHSRFFEALLGVNAETGARKAKELFTLPTFENLFDERVARSLERLGIAQALTDLRTQIAALDERLQRLEGRQEPRAPRSKR
jgi:hypothetical protein